MSGMSGLSGHLVFNSLSFIAGKDALNILFVVLIRLCLMEQGNDAKSSKVGLQDDFHVTWFLHVPERKFLGWHLFCLSIWVFPKIGVPLNHPF